MANSRYFKHSSIPVVVRLTPSRTNEVFVSVSTKQLARELAKDLMGVSSFGRAVAEGLEWVAGDEEVQAPSEAEQLRKDNARLQAEVEALTARLQRAAS